MASGNSGGPKRETENESGTPATPAPDGLEDREKVVASAMRVLRDVLAGRYKSEPRRPLSEQFMVPELRPFAAALTLDNKSTGLVDPVKYGPNGTGAFLQLDLRSDSIDPEHRERALDALGDLADPLGRVLVYEDSHRSHLGNVRGVVQRLVVLLTRK